MTDRKELEILAGRARAMGHAVKFGTDNEGRYCSVLVDGRVLALLSFAEWARTLKR